MAALRTTATPPSGGRAGTPPSDGVCDQAATRGADPSTLASGPARDILLRTDPDQPRGHLGPPHATKAWRSSIRPDAAASSRAVGNPLGRPGTARRGWRAPQWTAPAAGRLARTTGWTASVTASTDAGVASCRDDGAVSSVLIVDDETLVRSGLSMILDADPRIDVVGAVTGAGALEAVDTRSPDVVLLDIRMPDVDGLRLLAQITSRPDAPVVAMLTTFDSDDHLTAALRGGAAGFLLKNTDPTALTQMVHTLAAGGTVLAPGVNRTVLASAALDPDARARVATLTDRERDVLRLVAEGATNGEIAEAVGVSLGTVKDDVGTVLVKLGVRSRVLAALAAARAGLVDR